MSDAIRKWILAELESGIETNTFEWKSSSRRVQIIAVNRAKDNISLILFQMITILALFGAFRSLINIILLKHI